MTSPVLSQERESLNQLVADYDDSTFDRMMRHYMMRSLEPFLPSGRALELGCLYGEFTSLLATRYEDLTVVDAASEFLEVTRQRVGDRVRYHQSLFEEYRPQERFDAIFVMHILEHLLDPVLVLRQTRGWLTDNGRAFLVVPNGNAVSRQIAVKMGILPHLGALSQADVKHGHRRVYFLDTLQRDARDAGLRIVQSGGIFFKPLANFQFDGLVGGPYVSEGYMEGCYQLGQEYPTLCASIFLVCAK
jgi:2-polyprenyl-3-methyl-5-hydroxy-6-metoxy-1,4-benzoquinol methylase